MTYIVPMVPYKWQDTIIHTTQNSLPTTSQSWTNTESPKHNLIPLWYGTQTILRYSIRYTLLSSNDWKVTWHNKRLYGKN